MCIVTFLWYLHLLIDVTYYMTYIWLSVYFNWTSELVLLWIISTSDWSVNCNISWKSVVWIIVLQFSLDFAFEDVPVIIQFTKHQLCSEFENVSLFTVAASRTMWHQSNNLTTICVFLILTHSQAVCIIFQTWDWDQEWRVLPIRFNTPDKRAII